MEREVRRVVNRLYNVETRVARGVGAATAKAVNEINGHDKTYRFRVSEELLTILRRQRFDLIVGFTDEQRATVREAFRRALTDIGDLPTTRPVTIERMVAGHIKDAMTLDRRQAAAVRNFERRLLGIEPNGSLIEKNPPSPLYKTYKLRNPAFDADIDEAIRERRPLTGQQVNKSVGAYRDRALAQRAERIARTETIKVVNIARLEAWRTAAAEGRFRLGDVRRFWNTQDDPRVRNAHGSIPGLNANGRGLNSVFKTPLGDLLYPGDSQRGTAANVINCRCYVTTEVKGRTKEQNSEARRIVEHTAEFSRVASRR